MGLYVLVEAIVLILNGIAVLNEERFLSKFSYWQAPNQGFGDDPGVKAQLLNLIRSIRTVMRVPLIFINLVCICVRVVLG